MLYYNITFDNHILYTIEIKMNNNKQNISKNDSSVKSLLLLSANIRLIGALTIVACLWLVLGQLL
jgi:hypothetical protein